MITMIYAHSYIGSLQASLIFTFHMPLFFILSGYLYKGDKPLLQCVKHNVKKLLTPYTITSFILVLGRLIRYCYQPEFYGYCGRKMLVKETIIGALIGFGCGASESYVHFPFHEVWTVGALWFLLAFFWAIVLFDVAMRLSDGWNKMEKGIFILVISMVGILISYNMFWLPTDLDIGLFCVIFLYAGYLLRCYNITKYKTVTLAGMLLVVAVVAYSRQSISLNIRSVPSVLTIFAAFFGSILVIELSKKIEVYCPNFIKKVLIWFGKSGMLILCVHLLELELLPYDEIANELNMGHNVALVMVVTNFIIVIVAVIIIQKICCFMVHKRG